MEYIMCWDYIQCAQPASLNLDAMTLNANVADPTCWPETLFYNRVKFVISHGIT